MINSNLPYIELETIFKNIDILWLSSVPAIMMLFWIILSNKSPANINLF